MARIGTGIAPAQYDQGLHIEDPFNEDKFEDFARPNADAGIIIVGDDLMVTNPERPTRYRRESISGIIISSTRSARSPKH
jgi:enolase